MTTKKMLFFLFFFFYNFLRLISLIAFLYSFLSSENQNDFFDQPLFVTAKTGETKIVLDGPMNNLKVKISVLYNP